MSQTIGVIMRSLIDIGAMVTTCGSAIFWFASALCRLPSIKPGSDELDYLTEFAKALRRLNRRNFWAAGLMGTTALLSASGRFFGW
jgi:hypothetical protein